MSGTTMAVTIHAPGGPDALVYEPVPLIAPGEGQVLLRHSRIGLNFIDVAFRRTGGPIKSFPAVLGMEAAGTIEAVGPGVSGFAPGDRVSHCMVLGSYAERRVIDADRLIALPPEISEEIAAAATLQGLTAQYLLRSSYAVQPGDTVLIQAAAGGMGLLLCQWAKHLGATVIGTAGGPEKAALAAEHGCDHVIDYTGEDFPARVMEITAGAGVSAVYDAVGKSTFDGGLACLAERGHMVSYGNASGPVAPLDIATLSAKSLTVSRGSLGSYVKDPADRAARAAELWSLIADGALKIEINQRYPLAETARAHADLESRGTTGSTVLTP